SSQARVRGYYYVPSLAIGLGSLFRVLPLRGQFVDTLVLQVIACLRAPTHEAKVFRLVKPLLSVFLGGAGQRACTVPASATQRFVCSIAQNEQERNGTFIPSRERRRDFPCRFVK